MQFACELRYFLKKLATFYQFILSFQYISKTLQLNNVQTSRGINEKILVLLYVLKGSYVYHCIICMTVPLKLANAVEQ